MDQFNQFISFSKVDPEKHLVEGTVSSEAMDSQGEVVSSEAMKNAITDYMKFGNIREMHQPKAAGKTIKIWQDGDKTKIQGKIVDRDAWEKVREGVYNGFSIGGKKIKQIGNKITDLFLSEISLVDRPANPEAILTLFKRDDTITLKEYIHQKEVNEMEVEKAKKKAEDVPQENEEAPREEAPEAPVAEEKEEAPKEEVKEEKPDSSEEQPQDQPKQEKDVVEESQEAEDLKKIQGSLEELNNKFTEIAKMEDRLAKVDETLSDLRGRVEKIENTPIPVKAVKGEFVTVEKADGVSPENEAKKQKLLDYKKTVEESLQKAQLSTERGNWAAEIARVDAEITKLG